MLRLRSAIQELVRTIVKEYPLPTLASEGIPQGFPTRERRKSLVSDGQKVTGIAFLPNPWTQMATTKIIRSLTIPQSVAEGYIQSQRCSSA
jgi:hypothetical protein